MCPCIFTWEGASIRGLKETRWRDGEQGGRVRAQAHSHIRDEHELSPRRLPLEAASTLPRRSITTLG